MSRSPIVESRWIWNRTLGTQPGKSRVTVDHKHQETESAGASDGERDATQWALGRLELGGDEVHIRRASLDVSAQHLPALEALLVESADSARRPRVPRVLDRKRGLAEGKRRGAKPALARRRCASDGSGLQHRGYRRSCPCSIWSTWHLEPAPYTGMVAVEGEVGRLTWFEWSPPSGAGGSWQG
jgi:hypothetical protein